MAKDWSGNDYVPGGTYGICDRCGFKHRLSALKTEWTNLKVCGPCFDPRPAQLDAPLINPDEAKGIPGARPEILIEADDDDLDFPYR